MRDIKNSLLEVIQSVGNFQRQIFLNKIEIEIELKDKNSLVSFVDKESEIMLTNGLKNILPTASFVTEEATVEQNSKGLHWIIDPLDGTTNFLHRIPFYAISVALYNNSEPLLGVVYNVMLNELFYAEKNNGAWLNNQRIKQSNTISIADSLLATGFPYYDYSTTQSFQKTLLYFMQHTRGVRRCGSAAIDLCYTACGRFDAFWEQGLHVWDVAAGVIIAQESGCRVSDFTGKQDYLYGREIICASNTIYPSVLEKIKENYH